MALTPERDSALLSQTHNITPQGSKTSYKTKTSDWGGRAIEWINKAAQTPIAFLAISVKNIAKGIFFLAATVPWAWEEYKNNEGVLASLLSGATLTGLGLLHIVGFPFISAIETYQHHLSEDYRSWEEFLGEIWEGDPLAVLEKGNEALIIDLS